MAGSSQIKSGHDGKITVSNGRAIGTRIGMDSLAIRGFVGIDLGREPVPDETTVCRFRHLVDAAHIP
jgi:hypothetical protein